MKRSVTLPVTDLGRMVGFDSMFDTIDRFMESATSKVTFPPYNIAKLTEQYYQIQMALAGFSKDEISVRRENNNLVISVTVKERAKDGTYIHQGISMRDFLVKFILAEGVAVNDVVLDNGLLSVSIEKKTETPTAYEFTIKTPLALPSE